MKYAPVKAKRVTGIYHNIPAIARFTISVEDGYFSVTGKIVKMDVNGNISRFAADVMVQGAIGEEIKTMTHQYDDIIDFHLRDLDGSPIHTVENGWYFCDNCNIGALAKHLLISEDEARTIIQACKTKAEFEQAIKPMYAVWQDKAKKLMNKYGLKHGLQ